jgi:hypothetical protein
MHGTITQNDIIVYDKSPELHQTIPRTCTCTSLGSSIRIIPLKFSETHFYLNGTLYMKIADLLSRPSLI